MNILLTLHLALDPNGGAAGTTMDLARAYENEGHTVRLLSHDDMPARLAGRRGDLAFPAYVALWLRRYSAVHGIDVVDASTGDAWIWSMLRYGRGPVLVTRSHGLEHMAHLVRVAEAEVGANTLSWKYPLYHGGIRLRQVAVSLKRADLTLFLNQPDRDFAISHLGVAAEEAHVVHNGIPEYFLRRNPPDGWKSENAPMRIAQVGSYISRKGVRYGALALARVLLRHREMSVAFYGTGCARARVLEDFPTELHERVQVVPTYQRGGLPELLAGHQITLFPTLFEGFGKTLLEAMACGLAPVTTTAPGPTEFVRDGENGLLAPPSDPDGLESALERLIEDRALLGRLRRGAYETAQGFGWRGIARARLALYQDALDRKNAPARVVARA